MLFRSIELILKQYDSLQILSQMLHYREKSYGLLLSLFNSQQSGVKCHEALLDSFTAIIPYFEFSNNELYHRIVKVLRQFKQIAREKKNIKLTWSEDVTIWLMKQCIDNITQGKYTSVQRLIEVHVLTRLAATDQLISPGDHVQLNVLTSESSNKEEHITVQILNRRYDTTLRKQVSHIQSSL